MQVLILLLFGILSGYPVQDGNCNLSKTLDLEFMKVKHSENWNHLSVKGRHSLMYYEEKNWERREEAEIGFMKVPIDRGKVQDTSQIGFLYAEFFKMMILNSEKNKNGNVKLTSERVSAATIAKKHWKKVDMSFAGHDNGELKEFSITAYLTLSDSSLITITINHQLPRISTVDRELPCILKSMEFKN